MSISGSEHVHEDEMERSLWCVLHIGEMGEVEELVGGDVVGGKASGGRGGEMEGRGKRQQGRRGKRRGI